MRPFISKTNQLKMTYEQKLVRDFMIQADQVCPTYPTMVDPEIKKLRVDLAEEELREYKEAKDEVEVADAIADLLYVVLGMAVAHGIFIKPVFDEVHKSNMSKFIDGHKDPVSGKWIKGPSTRAPDIASVLRKQQ